MTWARLDDQFAENPKVWNLTDAAYRLHTAGICKSAQLLLNGVVADNRIPGLSPSYKPKFLAELVQAGMWHTPGHDCPKCEQPPEGHHIIHDFLESNPSREKVLADREAAATRKAAWKKKRDEEKAEAERKKNGVPNGVPHSGKNGSPNPTRPNPAQPTGLGLGSTGSSPAADGGDEQFDRELSQRNAERIKDELARLRAKRSGEAEAS